MKEPILGNLSPAAKLLFVILLLIFCFILISFAGILLAIPLFDINLFTDLSMINDFENPALVGMLKYLQIVQSIGLFILPSLIAAFVFGQTWLSYLGMEKRSVGLIFLGTFLLMFAMLPLVNSLTSLNEMIRLPEGLKGVEQWMLDTEKEAAKITETFLNVDTFGGLMVNLLMIAVIPSLGEEMLFRGLLQRLFSDWFRNVHIAIVFTAFVFGAIHMQFYGIIPRVFLGIVFGYLYFWSGSLWVPIFAHFINNGSAVIVAYFENRGDIATQYQDFGATNNVFLIIGSVVLSTFLLFWIYRTGKNYDARLK